MSIDLINNFIFGDGSNFTFGDGTNFIFGERAELSEDTQELIEYYKNLLIIQYNNKPNAKATIEALIYAIVADSIILAVRDGYDVDTAVGEQLNTLGKYIGVDRFYEGVDLTGDFFGFADATNVGGVSANIIGLNDAQNPDKEGNFLSSDDTLSTNFILDDDTYRTLLRFQIIQNASNYSTKSIIDSINDTFDNVIVIDNQNMTGTYIINGSNSLIEVLIYKDLLPKPMGVRLEVIRGEAFFGFADATNLDASNTYLKGFNDATAGFTQDGKFLNSANDIIT